jgi:hypothetical protein
MKLRDGRGRGILTGSGDVHVRWNELPDLEAVNSTGKGAATTSLTHDSNGNVTAVGKTTSYAYDFDNRLTAIKHWERYRHNYHDVRLRSLWQSHFPGGAHQHDTTQIGSTRSFQPRAEQRRVRQVLSEGHCRFASAVARIRRTAHRRSTGRWIRCGLFVDQGLSLQLLIEPCRREALEMFFQDRHGPKCFLNPTDLNRLCDYRAARSL